MAAEPIDMTASVEFDLDTFFASSPPPVFDFALDAPFHTQSTGDAITGHGNVQPSGIYPNDPAGCFRFDGLERFLLDEDDVAVEDFLVDPLYGDPDATSRSCEGAGASPYGSGPSPGSDESETCQGEGDVPQGKHGEEGEDPDDKKLRRQLRNRDSAMKSRERRKLYVHDLEKKTKYLESECRRLQYLLHCCTAENVALHQHLQKGRRSGDCGAKQESAVLFMKPLLLGSLFWLTSIVYLFLAPNLLAWRPQMSKTKQKSKGLAPNLSEEIKGAKDPKSREVETGSTADLAFMRRRCKALRTKIKAFPVDISHVFLW